MRRLAARLLLAAGWFCFRTADLCDWMARGCFLLEDWARKNERKAD